MNKTIKKGKEFLDNSGITDKLKEGAKKGEEFLNTTETGQKIKDAAKKGEELLNTTESGKKAKSILSGAINTGKEILGSKEAQDIKEKAKDIASKIAENGNTILDKAATGKGMENVDKIVQSRNAKENLGKRAIEFIGKHKVGSVLAGLGITGAGIGSTIYYKKKYK